MELEFTNLLVVVAIAFAAPLALGLAPRVRLPAVVLELVAGIVVGPSVLGWVEVDDPVEVLSLLGLAFLLFLAGLEIEFHKLRGQVLKLAVLGFALSFALAVAAGFGLDAVGMAGDPLFIAIVLCATSLGVIIPVLKDAGESGSTFGQWSSRARRSPTSRRSCCCRCCSRARLRASPARCCCWAGWSPSRWRSGSR